MPNKKRLFSKHNSTKYVLCSEGRDEDGNKIAENVLVPVKNHVSGSSLALAHLAEFYGKTTKNPNLESILNEIEETSEDEYENVKIKFKKMKIFDNSERETEEGDDSSDGFGQFSDADSDIDINDFLTQKTLSASKADCPESLKILNDGFDKIFEEYDENQIGALDDEEICGWLSTENDQVKSFMDTPINKNKQTEDFEEYPDETVKEKILRYTETDEEEKTVVIKIERPLEFDCESILSTYSNIYNHPVIIKEEPKIKKIKISQKPLQKTLTKSKLKELDSVSESDEDSDEMSVSTTAFNTRSKEETPEQKRERKNLFKEIKRESRKLKKENQIAFKNEKKKQISQAMNIRNTRGIKLI